MTIGWVVTKNAAFMTDEDDDLPPLPAGKKNYMTPQGHARLVAERRKL